MIIEIIGWLGSITILLAFWLNSTGKVKATSWKYQSLNIVGGVSFIINTYVHGAYPSTALNIVWVIIALYTLYKAYLGKPKVDPYTGEITGKKKDITEDIFM